MFIKGSCFDDLLADSLRYIEGHGESISPSKGDANEIIGAHLLLENARARMSRSELRAKLTSALGETLWYLSGSDDFDHISYYIPDYRSLCNTPKEVVKSQAAYGPRIVRQLETIMQQVKKDDSRKAILQIFSEEDTRNAYEQPCTSYMQFLPRKGCLHLSVHMRSSDAFIGFTHDLFAFTFIQEYVAACTGLTLGCYHHHAGSFHLYNKDKPQAQRYLEAGMYEPISMPRMPLNDTVLSLESLLDQERQIRLKGDFEMQDAPRDYWGDLARLLWLHRLRKEKRHSEISGVRQSMFSHSYDTYLLDIEDVVSAQG